MGARQESVKLAKLTILTSSKILDFMTEMDKRITVKDVEGLRVATITKDEGFKFYQESNAKLR